MNPEWWVIITGYIAASVPGVYAIFSQRKKVSADTRKITADAIAQYNELTTSQTKQILELTNIVNDLRVEVLDVRNQLKQKDLIITEWTAGISLLINQLTVANIPPIWKPKPIE